MRGQIVFNRPLSATYRHLGVVAAEFPLAVAPGQFVMVRQPLVADPFLPRAFSVYRISSADGDGAPVVEILYKVLGKGTQCLSRMEPGQRIEMLGPLGNAFTVSEGLGTAVLVAGGIGVPPIAALAVALAPGRERERGRGSAPIEVFLGGQTSDDILCVRDFEAVGAHPRIATEDGSLGTRGLVTEILEPFLMSVGKRAARPPYHREGPARPMAPSPDRLGLFTCGPPAMLAAVSGLAERYGVPCQASVEANMACGFGACMGCAVAVRSNEPEPSYKLVCKDGPVFDARVIDWGAESSPPRSCVCHRPEVQDLKP